jgi:hypothetical protein
MPTASQHGRRALRGLRLDARAAPPSRWRSSSRSGAPVPAERRHSHARRWRRPRLWLPAVTVCDGVQRMCDADSAQFILPIRKFGREWP